MIVVLQKTPWNPGVAEDQSVVIINLRKLFKEIDGGLAGMGNSWVVGMVIFNNCFVLMLCDLYTVIEKGRVYQVDKMNVGCWVQACGEGYGS